MAWRNHAAKGDDGTPHIPSRRAALRVVLAATAAAHAALAVGMLPAWSALLMFAAHDGGFLAGLASSRRRRTKEAVEQDVDLRTRARRATSPPPGGYG